MSFWISKYQVRDQKLKICFFLKEIYNWLSAKNKFYLSDSMDLLSKAVLFCDVSSRLYVPPISFVKVKVVHISSFPERKELERCQIVIPFLRRFSTLRRGPDRRAVWLSLPYFICNKTGCTVCNKPEFHSCSILYLDSSRGQLSWQVIYSPFTKML
jgi:hypothetical protein